MAALKPSRSSSGATSSAHSSVPTDSLSPTDDAEQRARCLGEQLRVLVAAVQELPHAANRHSEVLTVDSSLHSTISSSSSGTDTVSEFSAAQQEFKHLVSLARAALTQTEMVLSQQLHLQTEQCWCGRGATTNSSTINSCSSDSSGSTGASTKPLNSPWSALRPQSGQSSTVMNTSLLTDKLITVAQPSAIANPPTPSVSLCTSAWMRNELPTSWQGLDRFIKRFGEAYRNKAVSIVKGEQYAVCLL